MSSITIKRGDSLEFTLNLTDENGDPIILTVDKIKSQIRNKSGALIDTFTITPIIITPGEYEFKTDSTDTYPIGTHEFDVQIEILEKILSTETLELIVVKDITRLEV